MAGEESGVLTDCRHDLTNHETNMQGIMGYEPSNSKMQLFILFSILSDADEDSKSFGNTKNMIILSLTLDGYLCHIAASIRLNCLGAVTQQARLFEPKS